VALMSSDIENVRAVESIGAAGFSDVGAIRYSFSRSRNVCVSSWAGG
jgi:hypothetical protein